MSSIFACKTPKEKIRFERLPELLHGTNPAFIPPFPGSIVKYLSRKSAFQKRHGEILPFIAWRDGRPVGRIAAIVNRSHNEYYRDRTGFFGFFECENNAETAAALFAKAAEVLKEKGLESIRGPYNPSINDEVGLLTDAFDLPPCNGLTWNPPFYPDLLAGAGFTAVCNLFAMLLPMHRLPEPTRLARIVDRIAKRSRLKLRPMNLKNLAGELQIVHEVYNATLERNWGFVPISMDDLLGAADDIKAIADPKLLLIAEADGKSAGVAITLPNFNEILGRIKKTPHWLRLPHILWLMKTHRINSCRQVVLGVSPAYRDRGIHAWLIHEQFMRAQERYDNATLGWMEESNTEILEHSAMVGGERDRTWKIFEKSLKPA
ncbi:MAG: hypothetical protein WCQ57_04765 [Verrucomicrobiota bacterium]